MAAKSKSAKSTSADTTLMILASVAALLVGAFSVFLYKNKTAALLVTPAPKMMTVALSTQNNSSETGTATLVEKGGKTVVTLDVKGAPKGISQPAHIHIGSCPNPGAVKYPLISVVNGKSETTIEATLDQLKALGKLAINVHKSATQSKIYVACGDLKF